MKQDNADKGISWDIVINSIILYFLIEASEYIHPTISAKKKKVTWKADASYRKRTLDGGHVAESNHDRNDVKGSELHGGRGDGLGIGRLTTAEKCGDSSCMSPWKSSLEDIPGNEPHYFADLPVVSGSLIRNSFNFPEESVLLVGVWEADEVFGVGVVGKDGDARPHRAAILPDSNAIHEGGRHLLHLLKLLLRHIPGLVQDKHQLGWMHRTFRFS